MGISEQDNGKRLYLVRFWYNVEDIRLRRTRWGRQRKRRRRRKFRDRRWSISFFWQWSHTSKSQSVDHKRTLSQVEWSRISVTDPKRNVGRARYRNLAQFSPRRQRTTPRGLTQIFGASVLTGIVVVVARGDSPTDASIFRDGKPGEMSREGEARR
jgi:hypothetical protein